MQNGLFSSLPTLSNWPARADLAVASAWAARAGLARPGDFAALFSPPDAPSLWIDRSGVDAKSVREGEEETAPSVLTGLAKALPHPVCLILASPKHARALATLAEPVLPPICAESARLHGRHAVLPDYAAQAPAQNLARLAQLVTADTRAVVLGGHGILTVGSSVAMALGTALDFERAAQTYLMALASGQPLRNLPAEVIAALQAPDDEALFAALKRDLGNDRD